MKDDNNVFLDSGLMLGNLHLAIWCQLRPNTKNTKKEKNAEIRKDKKNCWHNSVSTRKTPCLVESSSMMKTLNGFYQISIFPWPLIVREYQHFGSNRLWTMAHAWKQQQQFLVIKRDKPTKSQIDRLKSASAVQDSIPKSEKKNLAASC